MPFVKLSKVTLHYEHAGHGRTILVLVHGNFASWRWWLPYLQQLSPEQYTLYAPDLRGCGDSDHPSEDYAIERLAEDIHEFVTALKLPKFHLVGHSLGGAVSLQFALNHSNLLHTLTLVSPAPAEGMPHLKRTLFGIGPAELNHLARSLDLSRSILRRVLKDMIPTLSPEVKEFAALLDDAVRMSPHALEGFVQSLADWNVLEQCPNLHLPVLILWGEQDVIVKRDALERMQDALPNARLLIWPDVGHAPQLEQEGAFTQVLSEFVNTPQHTTSDSWSDPHFERPQSWRARLRLWLSQMRPRR